MEEIASRKAEIAQELNSRKLGETASLQPKGCVLDAAPEPSPKASSLVSPIRADREDAAGTWDAAYKRPAGTAPQPAASDLASADNLKKAAPLTDHQPYAFPTLDLLNMTQHSKPDTRIQDAENAACLEQTLESFGIPAKVQRVTHGPAITRFELGLASSGINVKRILSIADNIALEMAANGGVRIEIPIPGTNLFGIEIPNKEITGVSLAEVLISPEMSAAKSPLTVALGRDIAGTPVLCDLSRMPHLLIAGQTGSGKSVCVNAIINSILYRASPEQVRMIMIDPKVVELQSYNVVPHLLIPVVCDPHKAAGALAWAVAEMLDRYHKMQVKNVREISAYNTKLGPDETKLPRIVIIIDELADLMLACKKEVEESIIRLAQLARAAGIHMVVATQRPTVDVITGLIKANIPSRISFAVSSSIDSRTILDMNGAEKLLGRGDMFYFPTGASAPVRVQGCFLSDGEIERVVNHIGAHTHVEFDPNIIEALNTEANPMTGLDDLSDGGGVDDKLQEAIEMAIMDGQASISMLQRRMKIGYARAGRLIDDMATRGVISKAAGSKPREVLISREEYERMKASILL
ncbi:MAG: DNA translocase FtsK [Clostridia bacterium]|nr:DNA translocase FtsK [Clostridia bacterium]